MKIIKETPDYVSITGPSIYSLFDIAKRSGIQKSLVDALHSTTIVCRSEKPRIAIFHFNVRSLLIPRDENTTKGILILLQKYDLRDKKIAIFWHDSYSQELSDAPKGWSYYI